MNQRVVVWLDDLGEVVQIRNNRPTQNFARFGGRVGERLPRGLIALMRANPSRFDVRRVSPPPRDQFAEWVESLTVADAEQWRSTAEQFLYCEDLIESAGFDNPFLRDDPALIEWRVDRVERQFRKLLAG